MCLAFPHATLTQIHSSLPPCSPLSSLFRELLLESIPQSRRLVELDLRGNEGLGFTSRGMSTTSEGVVSTVGQMYRDISRAACRWVHVRMCGCMCVCVCVCAGVHVCMCDLTP